MSKLITGIVLMVLGAILGLYVGLWVCFIGGIVDVIDQIRAENLEAMVVAWGIAKVIFAGFFGYLSAAVLMLPGYALIAMAD